MELKKINPPDANEAPEGFHSRIDLSALTNSQPAMIRIELRLSEICK